MALLKQLADETVVTILEFLRAVDLASVSEVDKTIFRNSRISSAVKFQLENIYVISGTPVKDKKIPDSPMGSPGSRGLSQYSCDVLYVREIKSILLALGSPVPVTGRGYWISTSWVANAKKYFEAINLPEPRRKAGAKKLSKIRQRRGSDSLPPWPFMNSDITCTHDALALTRGLRAKKRLMDGKAWFFLRKFYPAGPQFKSTICNDCSHCTAEDDGAKASATEKKEAELRVRTSSLCRSGTLGAVLARKHGVPSHMLMQRPNPRLLSGMPEDEWMALFSSSPSAVATSADTLCSFAAEYLECPQTQHNSPDSAFKTPLKCSDAPDTSSLLQDQCMFPDRVGGQPLVPGSYHLVPRSWLKSWRLFNKDLSVKHVPPLDCTSMLCHAHGMLLVPCHVEEYLVGLRKTLLGGLGSYTGDVVEILTSEEWASLLSTLNCLSDFSVGFTLDGENVMWNQRVCCACARVYGSSVLEECFHPNTMDKDLAQTLRN